VRHFDGMPVDARAVSEPILALEGRATPAPAPVAEGAAR